MGERSRRRFSPPRRALHGDLLRWVGPAAMRTTGPRAYGERLLLLFLCRLLLGHWVTPLRPARSCLNGMLERLGQSVKLKILYAGSHGTAGPRYWIPRTGRRPRVR